MVSCLSQLTIYISPRNKKKSQQKVRYTALENYETRKSVLYFTINVNSAISIVWGRPKGFPGQRAKANPEDKCKA